jgi:hypothetical protein
VRAVAIDGGISFGGRLPCRRLPTASRRHGAWPPSLARDGPLSAPRNVRQRGMTGQRFSRLWRESRESALARAATLASEGHEVEPCLEAEGAPASPRRSAPEENPPPAPRGAHCLAWMRVVTAPNLGVV